MLMKPDIKKMATLIIGKSKPDNMEGPPDAETPEQDHGLESAAEDLMSALESKDKKAFIDAFKAMMDLCESSEEPESSPEEG